MILTISGNTGEEISAKLLSLAKMFGAQQINVTLPPSTGATGDPSNGELYGRGPAADAVEEETEASPATTVSVTSAAEPVAAKVKRGRRTKAEIEAATAVEAAPQATQPVAAAPAEAPAAPAAPAGGADPKAAVGAALTLLNSKKGIAAARAVLTEFGAAKMSDLAVDKYPAFIAACEKAAA